MASSKELAQIKNYYLFQSKIYDLTRWTFLFGRASAVRHIPFQTDKPLQILEVGCGTGSNTLRLLKKYPQAQITALDLSPQMLAIAKKKLAAYSQRVTFLEQPYGPDFQTNEKYDVIFMAYILTMLREGHPTLLDRAYEDLSDQGLICIADFHHTKFGLYHRFMNSQHIQVEGQLLPELDKRFKSVVRRVRMAYLGIWTYLVYVGRK